MANLTNTKNPALHGIAGGGWTQVTDSSKTGELFIAIYNVGSSSATVTFTSTDVESGNSETVSDLDIEPGVLLTGFFSSVSVSAGAVLASYQLSKMPSE